MFSTSVHKDATSPLESILDFMPKKDVKLLLQPYYYTVMVPKSNIRSDLIKAYNYWTNLPDDFIQTLDHIMDMTYEGFTLLDDCMDDSELRRGIPSGYMIFGSPQVGLTTITCLLLAIKKLTDINKEVAQVYTKEMLRVTKGFYKDLVYRDNQVCPTMEEYNLMAIDRNSGVMGLPLKLLQTLASHKCDYEKIRQLIGLYVSYMGDLSNLCNPATWENKDFCQDISEGKFTPPMIHAVNSGTIEGDIVFNIVRQRPKDVATKKYCLSLMEKLGSIDYARKITEEVEKELKEEIRKVGGNPLLIECIDKVKAWQYEEICTEKFNNTVFHRE